MAAEMTVDTGAGGYMNLDQRKGDEMADRMFGD